MIRVILNSKDKRHTLLIPYVLINVCIFVLTIKSIQKLIHKKIMEQSDKREVDFRMLLIDKRLLKPIVKELKAHKGLLLVDMNFKDGSEVKIRL